MNFETLNAHEARVLGTLMEKSLSTPDHYPLTLNALRNACNQKTCREPVSDYSDAELMTALNGLKRKCLITFIPYGSQNNQFKFRHFLEDPRFNLFPPAIALLSVLLLRGPQTLNDLRLRTASLHAFNDLPAVELALQVLRQREEPLVELLEKRPGWKEIRWQQLPFPEGERFEGENVSAESTAPMAEARSEPHTTLNAHPQELASTWQSEVALLKEQIQSLRQEMAELREALGG